MKESLKSIHWTKADKVKKQYAIVAIGTIVLAVASFGVDMLAQLVLKLIF